MPKKEKIQEMFDVIATDYDRLNHIMSLGIDKTWRSRAIKQIAGAKVLDIACGTGDFSIAIAKKTDASVTGLDLSEGMLKVMDEKVRKGEGYEKGDKKCLVDEGDGITIHSSLFTIHYLGTG